MKVRLALLIALVVVVAVSAWWILREDGTPIEAKPPAPLVTSPPPAAPTPASAPTTTALAHTGKIDVAPFRAEPETDSDAAPTGPWLVTGTVVDAQGAPVGDLTVVIKLHDGVEDQGPTSATRRVRADARGSFSSGLPTPDHAVTVVCSVESDRFESRSPDATVFRGDPAPPPFVIRVAAFDAAVIGKVTARDGKPLGAAEVGWSRKVKADDAGSYRFPIVARNSQVWMMASAPGFARQQRQVQSPPAGGTLTCDFQLGPAAVVIGTVKRPDGTPVAGAEVWAWTSERAKSLTTEDGRFRLAGFDPEAPWNQMTVDAPHCARANVRLEFKGLELNQDVVVTPGVEVAGLVVDQAGHPVESATVSAGLRFSIERVDVSTDREGHFRFSALKPGKVELYAHRRGFSETPCTVDVPEGRPKVEDVRIVLAPAHHVSGKVTGPDGSPVVGIALAGVQHGEYLDSRTTTGEGGKFTIADLPAGEVELEVYGRGWLRARHPVVVDRDDVVLIMKRPGRIGGRVIDATTREPIKRFTIRLVPPELQGNEQQGGGYSSSWGEEGHLFEVADGYWSIDDEDLTPGAVFGAQARSEGHSPATATHLVAAVDFNRDANVLALARSGRVLGTVRTRAANDPVANARVVLMSSAEHRQLEANPWWEPVTRAKTGTDGRFEFADAPAGEVWLQASHPDLASVTVGPLVVTEGGAVNDVVLALDAGATVNGILGDADDRPVGSAAVEAYPDRRPSGRSQDRHGTTDAAGRFSFSGLDAGWWTFAQRDPESGIPHVSRTVNLTAGETRALRLGCDGTAAVRIRVKCDKPLPASVSVNVSPITTSQQGDDRTRAHRGAAYHGDPVDIRGLDAGTYQAFVSGYAPGVGAAYGSKQVTVRAGETVEVEIEVTIRPINR